MRRSSQLRRWIEEARQDFRYALRQHRRDPASASLIVVILAIGIGANVTMVGAIDHLLFRAPSHVRDPERVVRLLLASPSPTGGEYVSPRSNYPTFLDLRREVSSLEAVGAYTRIIASFGVGPEAIAANTSLVSASFFSVFGVKPALGTLFPEDQEQDSKPVAVLGYGFWQRQLGGDVGVVGRTIRIGDLEYDVVGVTPKGFQGAQSQVTDVWLPLTASTLRESRFPLTLDDRSSAWLSIIARMRAGANPASVEQQATTVWKRHNAGTGGADAPRRIVAASVIPARGPDRPRGVNVVLWLGGVSILVLFIACANVANLLIARALARRREIGMRLALGITPGRLARQMLAEALLLAGAGGFAALYFAVVGGRLVQRLLFSDGAEEGFLDARLFAITAAIAIGTGALISLAPLIQSMSLDLTSALRTGSAAGGGRRSRARLTLLATQAALCMLLLIAAGLFAQSLRRVEDLDLGVDLDRTLVAKIDLRTGSLPQAEVRAAYATMVHRVRQLPGVAHAALAEHDPYAFGRAVAAHTPTRSAESLWHKGVLEVPMQVAVDSGFFHAVGIRSLRGRDFQDTDRLGRKRVAIINEELAKLLWPGEEPLGQCMLVEWDGGDCVTVVGVVKGFWKGSILARDKLVVYVPMDQSDTYISANTMFIATRHDPAAVAVAVRRAIQSVRPDLPAVSVFLMRDVVSPELLPWQLAATMFTIFGGIALLIAVVGLYAVVAFTAAQRSQEIAIRIALGAPPANVLSLVARGAMGAVGLGLFVGILVALALRRRLGTMLFQTAPTDPAIILGVGALLLSVAAVASLIPTLRAARRNPATALRVD